MAQKMIDNDDTLQAVFPQIRCEPEKRKKELYKKDLATIIKQNDENEKARRESKRILLERERANAKEAAERGQREEQEEAER